MKEEEKENSYGTELSRLMTKGKSQGYGRNVEASNLAVVFLATCGDRAKSMNTEMRPGKCYLIAVAPSDKWKRKKEIEENQRNIRNGTRAVRNCLGKSPKTSEKKIKLQIHSLPSVAVLAFCHLYESDRNFHLQFLMFSVTDFPSLYIFQFTEENLRFVWCA